MASATVSVLLFTLSALIAGISGAFEADECPTDVCFCRNQRVIDCSEIFLQRFPTFFANSTNVTFSEIDLSENRIRYLGADSFRNILVQTVKIWNNKRRVNLTIHSKAFRGLESVLQRVSIRKSSIPDLPVGLFRGFFTLKSVDISGNRLQSIKRGVFGNGHENLETLHLDKNLLTAIDERVFSSLAELRELSVRKNLISFVDSRAFVGLSKLEHLDLRYNRIRDLQPQVFSYLRNLRRLDLASNDITALFPVMFRGGLKRLEALTLSNNPIIMIAKDTFLGMSKLAELRLDKSKLNHPKPGIFDGLVSLRSIYLQNSGIRSLPKGLFSATRTLTKIQLESNDLTTLNACAFDLGNRRERTDVWVKGNPIQCDCTVAWTSRSTSTVRVLGQCRTPEDMANEEIAYQGIRYRICTKRAGMEDCPQLLSINDVIGSKKNWIRIH